MSRGLAYRRTQRELYRKKLKGIKRRYRYRFINDADDPSKSETLKRFYSICGCILCEPEHVDKQEITSSRDLPEHFDGINK